MRGHVHPSRRVRVVGMYGSGFLRSHLQRVAHLEASALRPPVIGSCSVQRHHSGRHRDRLVRLLPLHPPTGSSISSLGAAPTRSRKLTRMLQALKEGRVKLQLFPGVLAKPNDLYTMTNLSNVFDNDTGAIQVRLACSGFSTGGLVPQQPRDAPHRLNSRRSRSRC